MQLKVQSNLNAWYSGGLRFTCTQCGNCCTGGPGFVWIKEGEVASLAKLLGITTDETIDRYCRMIGNRMSLREERNGQGSYDCVFLKEAPGGKRICGAYAARPAQCRQWPFWEGNLASKEDWERAGVRCPGINQGELHSAEEIEARMTEI
jgi:uncharacterized protein